LPKGSSAGSDALASSDLAEARGEPGLLGRFVMSKSSKLQRVAVRALLAKAHERRSGK